MHAVTDKRTGEIVAAFRDEADARSFIRAKGPTRYSLVGAEQWSRLNFSSESRSPSDSPPLSADSSSTSSINDG